MARSPALTEPRFMSRLRNYSVGKRNAFHVAQRNAISNRPREEKIFPTVSILFLLGRGNYPLSINEWIVYIQIYLAF